MMKLELLKIINHFGVKNQKLKLEEELEEIEDAASDYFEDVSRETLLHLREELGDAINVVDGLLYKNYFITPEESLKEQISKIYRTCRFIEESIEKKVTYEEVRNNVI